MRENESETSAVKKSYKFIENLMEILPKGSEAQDSIGLKFPEGILTPDVSGSSSLTSGTLAMFLDVLKTYGDVFARFAKCLYHHPIFWYPLGR